MKLKSSSLFFSYTLISSNMIFLLFVVLEAIGDDDASISIGGAEGSGDESLSLKNNEGCGGVGLLWD